MPHDGGGGVADLLPDDGNQSGSPFPDGFPGAGVVGYFLDGHDIPGLVPEALGKGGIAVDQFPLIVDRFGIDIVGPAFVVLPAMPFQGAAADIQAGNDDVADPGPFQQAGKVFRPVVGEAVSHRQDPEGVGVAGQGIVGRSREGDEGQKDNKKDSLHKWIQ